jgi:hypothetical protein
VTDAQEQALTQAKDMLDQTQSAATRDSLQAAIQEMERSKSALIQAQHAPEKLPAAVAAEQAAYEALLKVIPRETQISRSRNRGQAGGRAGEASREQIDQLELTDEESRYETESQAQTAPDARQREQLQTADRLKELAQRQQDLNDRLRELQTSLSEDRPEKEREEAQRQLQRLRDEERQMLADMDDLRQQLAQSPNANALANTRQQLDQTRSDAERAAQELDQQSPSQALAAGSRAQQELQNLRQDVKSQTSGQFAEQMRQMRNEARDLASQESQLAQGLDSLANSDQKSLDDSSPRQQLSEQMDHQRAALTNLLSQMQTMTEQAETTEPLLSQQLYAALRRESQSHTENFLEAGRQLVDRGFVSQASDAERLAHQNIDQLRQDVERAAESVLGSEADSLRFAEKELNDLAGQLGQELSGAATNSNFTAGSPGESNAVSRRAQPAAAAGDTNLVASRSMNGAQRGTGRSETDRAQNNGQRIGSQRDNGQGESGQGENRERGNGQREAANGNEPANEGSSGAAQGEQAPNASGERPANGGERPGANSSGGQAADDLGNLVRQLGGSHGAGGLNLGPITGRDFVDWSSRMRDVEQVLDEPALRNQLATARERVAAMRAEFRQSRIKPKPDLVRRQILDPITEVREQVRDDLARLANADSLVPLDHDPVPESYSELVRKYYETLGGP